MSADERTFADTLQSVFESLDKPLPAISGSAASLKRECDELRLKLAVRRSAAPGGLLGGGLDPATRLRILDVVAADCETGGISDQGRWRLRDSVRRDLLRSRPLVDIVSALAEIPFAGRDPVSIAVGLLLGDKTIALDDLGENILRALLEAREWFGARRLAQAINTQRLRLQLARAVRRADYAYLLDAGLYGRELELAELLTFCVHPAASPDKPQYFYLRGDGGVGKSTLVAAVADAVLRRNPPLILVHLDFDRPDLDPLRSLTLDLEFLQQAGNTNEEFHSDSLIYRQRVRENFRSRDAGYSRQSYDKSYESMGGESKSVMIDAIYRLSQLQVPVLLILDTFEQVEAAGDTHVAALLYWVRSLSEGWLDLRVVISGRGTQDAHDVADEARSRTWQLGELTQPAAVDMLLARKVPPELASGIAAAMGGSPLILRLTAELVRNLGAEEVECIIRDARDGRMPRELVQGLLYDRILKHVAPVARRYAHPGLALPELTRPLIRSVLGPLVGESRMSAPTADAIFNALASARWLVRTSSDGKRLMQRADLRRLMLRLMESDPERRTEVHRIREAAHRYHASRKGRWHRAFALYHGLMQARAADELEAFAGEDFGRHADLLRPYLEDLPAPAQALVNSSLQKKLGAEQALQQLPDRAWRQYLLGARDSGGMGDRLAEGADPMHSLDLWRRRPVPPENQPPSFALQALAETGEWHAHTIDWPLLIGRLSRTLEADKFSGPLALRALYWSIRLALLGDGLTEPHRRLLLDTLRANEGASSVLALATLAAVDAAFQRRVDPGVLTYFDRLKGAGGELRLLLGLALRSAEPFSVSVYRDAMVVAQRDWPARALRFQQLELSLGTIEPTPLSLPIALMKMDGQPLDRVISAIRNLRRPELLQPFMFSAERREAAQLLLRGTTPEFHRPARQALREAFFAPEKSNEEVREWLNRFRPALSICPREFETETLLPRMERDPASWLLSLVSFADRARVLETLLVLAAEIAPQSKKLRQVLAAFRKWDRALGDGKCSDWLASADDNGPAYLEAVDRNQAQT